MSLTLIAILAALLFARAWRIQRREMLMLRDERDHAYQRAEVRAASAATWEVVATENAEAAQLWRARWRYAEQTVLGVAVAIAKEQQADELAVRRRKPGTTAKKSAAVRSS